MSNFGGDLKSHLEISGWRSQCMSVTCVNVHHPHTKSEVCRPSRFEDMGNFGHSVKRPGDRQLLPLSSPSMSVMRVIVLHLYTKSEVRRPSINKDMADFRSRH